MISPQDLELFKKNYHLYEMLIKHSFVRNYTKDTYQELLSLYTKYVNDKHNFSHWCSSCRAELVNHLYHWYINEGQGAELPVEVVKEVEEAVIEQEIQISKKKRRK